VATVLPGRWCCCASPAWRRAAAGLGHGQRPEAGRRGYDAAVVMTRWMFPYIGFMSLVALAGGILNTWKRVSPCRPPRRCC
jgi:peptidoglycan biosynthesis protein MviN/MurJ (putative lipid II flippase)